MTDVKYPELAGKFRKKPVVIDAWCIDFNNTPYPEWVESAFNKDETEAGAIDWCPSGEGLYINTLEGHMQAAVGDFLIRGVAGELYACRADIFAATYEAAHLADAACALRGAQKESGWRPIAEAPAGELLVVGWLDPEDAENPERHHFDWLEDGAWQSHEDAREHFLMCAPPGSRGPKEAAPYTHFMRLGRIPAPTPEGEAK